MFQFKEIHMTTAAPQASAIPEGIASADHPINTFLTAMLTNDEVGQRTLPELLDYLLISAIEGGSNYWCDSILFNGKHPKPSEHGEEADYPWYSVAFRSGSLPLHVVPEGDAPIALTADMAVNGLRLLVEGNHCRSDIRDSLVNHNYDAETADVWLQLALFGEVVYG
jgi:hypothetical protein